MSFCGFNIIKDGKSCIKQWQTEDRAKEVVSGKRGIDRSSTEVGRDILMLFVMTSYTLTLLSK